MNRARDPSEINPALIDWNVFLSPTEHAQQKELNTSSSILQPLFLLVFCVIQQFFSSFVNTNASKRLWLWEKCAEMQINIFSDLSVMSVMSMFPFSSSDHLSRGRYYTGRAGI